MSSSCLERAEIINTGTMSKYYKYLLALNSREELSTEQMAIMSLILDRVQGKSPYLVESYKISNYFEYVVMAQALMPSGNITSKQILVSLWTQSRMATYIKDLDRIIAYEDI